MYLLKSTTGQTILFDDGEISFFNNPYITKQQRFIIAIFGIVIAVIGLFFHIKDKHLLFLIAYLQFGNNVVYGLVVVVPLYLYVRLRNAKRS